MNNNWSELHKISLINKENVTEAVGGKTLAFFCKEPPVLIDDVIIKELKEISKNKGCISLRICLHSSPNADHHDMIILLLNNGYYRPHKHLDLGETFHVMEGKMAVFSFDDIGNIYDCVILENNNLYRVKGGSYHAVFPISDIVVYHESRNGPFLRENDSIFPDWSANESDIKKVDEYTKRCYEAISKM